MSFVQKHKAWLLPVLGLGVVWAGWNISQSLKPSAPVPVKPENAVGTAPATPATPPPPPPLAPKAPGTNDLWSDLRQLDTPAAGLNQVAELVHQGASPLAPGWLQGSPRPDFRPARWKELPEPQFPRQTAGPEARPLSAPLPVLDFVLERQDARTREAWIGGKAYQEGQSPDGVHRIKHITNRSVLLVGPSGETLLTTDLGKSTPNSPKPALTARPAEAK